MTTFKRDCCIVKHGDIERRICPKCFNHIQLDCGDYDCKTIIYEDELIEGKLITWGQCCCYSKEHE